MCVAALLAGSAAMTGCSNAGGADDQAESEAAQQVDEPQGDQGAAQGMEGTTSYAHWGGGRGGRWGGGARGGERGGRGGGAHQGFRHAGWERGREGGREGWGRGGREGWGRGRREEAPWWRRFWPW